MGHRHQPESEARQRAGEERLLQTFWTALGEGERELSLPDVELAGACGGLPSLYPIDALATASIGAATAAVSALVAAREQRAPRVVRVDRQHAAAAFRSERWLAPIGWTLPALWDPIAGDYRASDGWIRIHTNYAHHRAAALRALAVPETKEAVAAAVAKRSAEELESAIVREGGCAAQLRSAAAWAAHPQGRAVAQEPLVALELSPVPAGTRPIAARASADGAAGGAARSLAAPLEGIRVLDLTRVIAGPVCTRVLAAWGAEVLRLDPPGFQEVPALLGETTAGKRRAFLDLHSREGRARFERLVTEADLLVCGYRSSVLERAGLGVAALRALHPGLAIVLLDAYGFGGPWRERRGFDSLVQMSCGIAEAQRAALGESSPVPLPAQALDHGSGYLLAAAAARALTRRITSGLATTARLSLARLAWQLELERQRDGDGDLQALAIESGEPWREREESGFGPLWRLLVPGSMEGFTPRFRWPAGPLGVDDARF